MAGPCWIKAEASIVTSAPARIERTRSSTVCTPPVTASEPDIWFLKIPTHRNGSLSSLEVLSSKCGRTAKVAGSISGCR